ncbi:MAG: ABC transporter permease [Thiogranum sp.]|nr:ABC transporter permease [Thiogranum sp.]
MTRRLQLNRHSMFAIYRFEMMRFRRTLWQSLVAPVITTVLYFVVFGAAIGPRMGAIDGVGYGAFIVPGLIMLSVFTESLNNAAFGIHMPKFTGTIYEILSAPISAFEVVLAYVGAAATKSVIIGLIILATANLFAPIHIQNPAAMVTYLMLVAIAFSLAGFIIGIWARGFEELQFIPMLIVMPLTFLGGVFYSIDILPGLWRTLSLFNPIVYLVSGYRWTFYGSGDVSIGISLSVLLAFLAISLGIVWWIFRTGYRLKS